MTKRPPTSTSVAAAPSGRGSTSGVVETVGRSDVGEEVTVCGAAVVGAADLVAVGGTDVVVGGTDVVVGGAAEVGDSTAVAVGGSGTAPAVETPAIRISTAKLTTATPIRLPYI
ncbi:hypothetical protein [Prescottella equi]